MFWVGSTLCHRGRNTITYISVLAVKSPQALAGPSQKLHFLPILVPNSLQDSLFKQIAGCCQWLQPIKYSHKDVMRKGALEKFCKDLWPEYPPRGVQDRSGSQAYLETASSWATRHWAVSRDSCLTLAVQGNVLCGLQCFQEENCSNGTEELEWRWAKSQEVTETHLMLLQANNTVC